MGICYFLFNPVLRPSSSDFREIISLIFHHFSDHLPVFSPVFASFSHCFLVENAPAQARAMENPAAKTVETSGGKETTATLDLRS